jgi:hypothetical protein
MTRSTSRIAGALLAVAVSIGLLPAQTSSSYKMTEATFDAGGDPANGAFAASASFRIRLDAIGGAVAGLRVAGPTRHLSAGLPADNAPPGEVLNVHWTDPQSLAWSPEKSVGTYNLYRGSVGTFSGFGSCLLSDLTTESASDTAVPAAMNAFFYLVTADNRLGEEGTKGSTSSGALRSNPVPCP